jgi:hypothetical protein
VGNPLGLSFQKLNDQCPLHHAGDDLKCSTAGLESTMCQLPKSLAPSHFLHSHTTPHFFAFDVLMIVMLCRCAQRLGVDVEGGRECGRTITSLHTKLFTKGASQNRKHTSHSLCHRGKVLKMHGSFRTCIPYCCGWFWVALSFVK